MVLVMMTWLDLHWAGRGLLNLQMIHLSGNVSDAEKLCWRMMTLKSLKILNQDQRTVSIMIYFRKVS